MNSEFPKTILEGNEKRPEWLKDLLDGVVAFEALYYAAIEVTGQGNLHASECLFRLKRTFCLLDKYLAGIEPKAVADMVTALGSAEAVLINRPTDTSLPNPAFNRVAAVVLEEIGGVLARLDTSEPS